MPDSDRYRLLFGPYRQPRCRLGRMLTCEVRGRVEVCGISDARIPWPIGKIRWARSLVVCGGLARAVRLETNAAVCHWWGVTPQTVSKWRKATGVGRVTPAYRRHLQEQYRRVFTPEQRARNVAKFTPERGRKISDTLRGRAKPPHEQERLRRLQLGRKASPVTRAKMSATHKALGTRPPSRQRKQFAESASESLRR